MESLPYGWEFDKDSKNNIYYINSFNGETQWEIPKYKIRIPNDWIQLISKSKETFWYNIRNGKSEWYVTNKGPTCINIKGLKWEGMSCYADSILVALFAQPNSFIDDNILNIDLHNNPMNTFPCSKNRNKDEDLNIRLKIQKELNLICNSIRGIGPYIAEIKNLRKLFKNCPDTEKYYNNEMKDSGEFLTYIFNFFPTIKCITNTLIIGTNNNEDTSEFIINNLDNNEIYSTINVDKKASVIRIVDPILLDKYDSISSSDLFEILDDDNLDEENLFMPKNSSKTFNRKITYTTIIDSPYLVLNLKRLSFDSKYIKTKVYPDETFVLQNGQKYVLLAVILFSSSHYTCIFKSCNEWYYYNDISSNSSSYELKKIGDLETNIDKYKIKTRGTQFLYIKENELYS